MSKLIGNMIKRGTSIGKAADTLFNATQRDCPSGEDALKKFCDTHNCQLKLDDRERGGARYYFNYQGGNFVAIVFNGFVGVEVLFPHILDAPLTQIDQVRDACNRRNYIEDRCKLYYTVDAKGNRVNVSIAFFTNALVAEEFAEALSSCFNAQREFLDLFDNIMKSSRSVGINDLERELSLTQREQYLIREQEINSQPLDWRPQSAPGQDLTLDAVARMWLEAKQVSYKSMMAMGGYAPKTGVRLTEASAIAQFPLNSLVIKEDGESTLVTGVPAMVLVTYTLPGDEQRQYTLTVTVQADGHSDGKAFYYRITLCQPAEPLSRSNSLNLNYATDGEHSHSTTLLAAHDVRPAKQRAQEFDFMWHDAQDKIAEGHADQLTDEQQLVADVTDANVAYNLYWGRAHMNQGRYFQALRHFLNAYRALTPKYFYLKKDDRNTYFRLCYYIGFCYCDMEMWEQAYYYLDIVAQVGRIDYAEEYVNVLANAADVRVFQAIDEVMNDVKEQYEPDEEMPENIAELVNFLRRRRAYSFINFGNLDEAQKQFEGMLNEADNRDYAIKELAYIQHLRAEQKELEADTPKGSKPQGSKGNPPAK